MPKILFDIQLWEPGRTAQISLPAGETVKGSLVGFPKVTRRLGGVDEMNLTVKSGCALAIATQADAYKLSQGKIIRFVYDDSSIQEWRIKSGTREFSGQDDVQITAEPIEQDLKDITIRKTLANGHTRASVSFYNQTFQDIATNLLSSEYNCPDLFTIGTVAAGLNDTTYNVVLNAAYVLEGLKKICQLAEAEWGISYNATNDNYEINFYEAGQLGGGEIEAADSPIAMGGGKGNRLILEKRDETEEYFSRVVPLMGEGSEIQTVAGARWRVDTATYNNPDSTVTLKENAIAKDGYGLTSGQTIYFGNLAEGWHEVTATSKPNRLTLSGDASGLTHGYFREGAAKNEIVLLEDADALAQVGLKEEKFQRPDIPPYANLIEDAGISPTLSDWSGGLPVGFQMIAGTETVSQATADIFVKHGTRSAKVSCDQHQGLQTDAITLEPEDLNPYFSSTVYLQVETGSVRVEIIDSAGKKHPKDKLAETNVKETRAIKIGGMEPAAGNAQIKIIAQSDNTVFYLDAITLTQSASAIEYAPLMGPKALWIEAGKYLKKYGGDRPDVWSGEVMDDAYFTPGSKEIEIGSFVKVQEDWNEGTGSYDTEFIVRVVEVSYQEDRINGRYKKQLRLADKNSEAARIFQEQYLTVGSQQSSLQVREVPQKPVIDIDNAVVEGGTPRFEQVEVYPSTAKPPLVLGSNAQGELVAGLNSDQLDGYEASSFIRDLEGTTNQINVTLLQNGATKLSTPQDIHKDADMTLNSLFLKQDLKLHDDNGGITTQTFLGGFGGEGVKLEKINGNHRLTVDDLVVRRLARFYEIALEKIRYNAGTVIIGPGGEKITDSTQTGDASWDFNETGFNPFAGDSPSAGIEYTFADQYECFIEEDKYISIVGDDLLKRQQWNGRGTGVTEGGVIATETGSATETNNTPRRSFTMWITRDSQAPGEGMEFAVIGNRTDPSRQNCIIITASDTGNPYRRICTGVDELPKFGSVETIKGQDGRLDNLDVSHLFPQLDGSQTNEYGAFWNGNFYVNDGNFRGTVTITDPDASNAATKDYVDENTGASTTIIRSSSEPSQRPSGDSLQEGDFWIDTSDGDKPYSYDGSGWVRAYTIIDGGDLELGSVTADKINISSVTDLDSDAAVISDIVDDYNDLSNTPSLGDVAALNEISSVYIGNGAVIAAKIASGAITADKLDVNELNAVTANTGNLTVDGIAKIVSGGELRIEDPSTDDALSISQDGVDLIYDAEGGTGIAELSWYDSAAGDLTGHVYAWQDKSPTPSVNTLVLRAPTNGGVNDSIIHLTGDKVQVNSEISFQNHPLYNMGVPQYNYDTAFLAAGEVTLNVTAPVIEVTNADPSTRIVEISLDGIAEVIGMQITVINSDGSLFHFGWRDSGQTSHVGANIRAENVANYDHRNGTAMTLTLGSDGWYVSNDHGA